MNEPRPASVMMPFRHWTDQPNHALGGSMPRQAIRTRVGRRQVVELLLEYPQSEERTARERGHEPPSLRFLWDELGSLLRSRVPLWALPCGCGIAGFRPAFSLAARSTWDRGFNRCHTQILGRRFAMQLTAVLTHAEEGGFIALNPETGTTTEGESIEEALENLREATTLYLQGVNLGDGRPSVLLRYDLESQHSDDPSSHSAQD